MRAERYSEYNAKDARELANSLIPAGGYIESGCGDCEAYPCPVELDSWSGQISTFDVYDEDGDCIAQVAYWE